MNKHLIFIKTNAIKVAQSGQDASQFAFGIRGVNKLLLRPQGKKLPHAGGNYRLDARERAGQGACKR
jgi:hypothetical protein